MLLCVVALGGWAQDKHKHKIIMNNVRKLSFLSILLMMLNSPGRAQNLELNDLEYFERQGVNILVFSNSFNGGFNDEKNSGIEVIHHGVRTVQGGAVRLNNTPEQWDLVPKMTSRKVDKEHQTIEVGVRYDDYDFDSRVVDTAKGKAVEISVWLDMCSRKDSCKKLRNSWEETHSDTREAGAIWPQTSSSMVPLASHSISTISISKSGEPWTGMSTQPSRLPSMPSPS